MADIDLDLEFPLQPQVIYLNHAAVAPWPKRTGDAVARFAQENVSRGATNYPHWLEVEKALRDKLARLIGAPSRKNIALQKNTSEGLSVIAYGLDWQAGDQIVISDQEFPSNRIVWESLQSQGVEVVEVSLDGPNPEQNLIGALNSNVKLLSISSVQYGTGLALDLDQLGQACRSRDILYCVDAIQSIGAMPFNVEQNQADFVVADGHKWMLGPEGVALFYLSDRMLNQLKLNQYGWHMVKNRGNYDVKTWERATDATRYECGSPNMLGAFALNSSLELLLEVGMEQVYEQLLDNVIYLQNLLEQRADVSLITDISRPIRSGIITFKHNRIDSPDLFEQLKLKGIVCAYRGGGIRFSPHFYTPKSRLEQAVEGIPQ